MHTQPNHTLIDSRTKLSNTNTSIHNMIEPPCTGTTNMQTRCPHPVVVRQLYRVTALAVVKCLLIDRYYIVNSLYGKCFSWVTYVLDDKDDVQYFDTVSTQQTQFSRGNVSVVCVRGFGFFLRTMKL